MNLKSLCKTKICCSRYSDLDDKVIEYATSLGLPLIGGTALEIWASATNTPGVRKRSDNDLDFIALSCKQIEDFRAWLISNIDPDIVKTDIYVGDSNITPYIKEVNGVLVMSLPYILWSKLTRPDRSEKDIQDIKWISTVSQVTDEELVECLEDLGVTAEEINLLNSIL